MANKRIEDLQIATTVNDNDNFVISQNSAAKSVTKQTLMQSMFGNTVVHVPNNITAVQFNQMIENAVEQTTFLMRGYYNFDRTIRVINKNRIAIVGLGITVVDFAANVSTAFYFENCLELCAFKNVQIYTHNQTAFSGWSAPQSYTVALKDCTAMQIHDIRVVTNRYAFYFEHCWTADIRRCIANLTDIVTEAEGAVGFYFNSSNSSKVNQCMVSSSASNNGGTGFYCIGAECRDYTFLECEASQIGTGIVFSPNGQSANMNNNHIIGCMFDQIAENCIYVNTNSVSSWDLHGGIQIVSSYFFPKQYDKNAVLIINGAVPISFTNCEFNGHINLSGAKNLRFVSCNMLDAHMSIFSVQSAIIDGCYFRSTLAYTTTEGGSVIYGGNSSNVHVKNCVFEKLAGGANVNSDNGAVKETDSAVL